MLAVFGLLPACGKVDPADSGSGGQGNSGSGGEAGASSEIDWGGCTYDPGLKANIVLELEEQQLTSVRDLTDLDAWREPYASLAGIECLANLESLGLSHYFPEGERPVLDLSPLADLDRLYRLSLVLAGFSELEVLADGPLRELLLARGPIDSLEPLRRFDQLQQLELVGLSTPDLEPLSGLRALRSLRLDDLPISDFEPLSGLPSLARLTLASLDMQDFEGLVGLNLLTELRVLDVDFTSFAGISSAPNLVSLEVSGCDEIESFDGLEACRSIETIEVKTLASYDVILMSDLSALRELTSLTTLDLAGARVTDLGPLAGLPLRYLDLSSNQVESIDALAGMPLSTLLLANNEIVTLPEGFVGGQGACSRTDLTGNPLDVAAAEQLEALCAMETTSGYAWDGGDCPAVCEAP